MKERFSPLFFRTHHFSKPKNRQMTGRHTGVLHPSPPLPVRRQICPRPLWGGCPARIRAARCPSRMPGAAGAAIMPGGWVPSRMPGAVGARSSCRAAGCPVEDARRGGCCHHARAYIYIRCKAAKNEKNTTKNTFFRRKSIFFSVLFGGLNYLSYLCTRNKKERAQSPTRARNRTKNILNR